MRQRIIIPFALLFMGVTLISFFLYQHLVTSVIKNSLELKLKKIANVISTSGISLNRFFLSELKKITGVDIVILDNKGKVLVTTIEDISLEGTCFFPLKRVDIREIIQNNSKPLFRIVRFEDRSYAMWSQQVKYPPKPETCLILISSYEEANRLISRIKTGTIIISIGAFVLLMIIGTFISRNFTNPISKLVEATKEIAQNKRSIPLPISRKDEIGELATAFSEMLRQLKEYETQLIETEKIATAGKIAAEVAHEIKNPLSSIKMMSQLLASRLGENDKLKAIAEKLISEIRRLETIVETALESFRTERPDLKLSSIGDAVSSTIELLLPQLRHLGIEVEVSIDENIPQIYLDEIKIKQALLNVLKNAFEAMPEGGKINISVKANSRHVHVMIDDEGEGIPEHLEEKIFDPFFTTKNRGTGLGLHTTLKIVRLHGGNIKASTSSSGGARITISLPIPGET